MPAQLQRALRTTSPVITLWVPARLSCRFPVRVLSKSLFQQWACHQLMARGTGMVHTCIQTDQQYRINKTYTTIILMVGAYPRRDTWYMLHIVRSTSKTHALRLHTMTDRHLAMGANGGYPVNFEAISDQSDGRQRRWRGNLPKAVTDTLRVWFTEYIAHPYPMEEEKQILVNKTGLEISQVCGALRCPRSRMMLTVGPVM